MTPTPQEHVAAQEEFRAPDMDGEGVVISGMSGLYPSSHHVKEFSDILYNKVNPVNEESLRWTYCHPEVAHHAGAVPDLERFDAQFFKVHFRLSNSMDPMSRKILEQAYHAIYDAGINPEHLSGQKIGVFVGTCFSEAEKSCFYDASSRSGLGITGCCKAMFANRVSYWLNAKGPSMAIDEACCSSTAALEQAFLAMSRGECVAAIVGGANLCLHPQSSVHNSRIMTQCTDGKTKSFDCNADGCVKTDAINILFLQKAKDALRVYAHVMHAKTAFIGMQEIETGPRFGFYRNHDATVRFLERFYEEARVPPHAVEYVEAFGSAVPEADKGELEAFDKVFCKEKDDTLLVGSVTSNIGYGEAASGISSITKVLLGYHYGKLAANLHCTNPRQDIVALRDGRMRIVTEHESFGRTYAAVNGMSVTGVNSHVLLHGHYKPKDLARYHTNIPHLVTISGRQENVVKKILEDLKSRPVDPEELALLHNIHKTNIAGHLGRGFIILQTNEEQKTVSLCERAEYFDDAAKPLWFVYSGMGSQWAGMGTQLMRIPIFAAAIERCRVALEPKGIDIVHIITSTDKTIFDNILHSFVGIAAVQIGLTDVLRELGLVPDGIIGHSVGELGCAYADGCLTAEEMILSAYSRGLVSLQTEFIRGSMAAIGLGYDKISKLCPPEIEVACHNGPESSTISGPADIMREFVAELTAKGIFAKEVPCSNIAYHSRYIAGAGPGLLKYLTEVIKTPRARSERWVSTSVPEARWDEPLAKMSSAEYHTNNLLNPVLFEETLCHIPRNAVLVEVAPHGLLQAILKRSLSADYCNIALTRRGHPDNAFMLLEAVGKLYMEGYNPQVEKLYPKVEMPVSTGTPFLSHLIEWAHGERWAMPIYRVACRKTATACNYLMSLHDKEHEYLQGHVIRGKTLYPFAATLVSVWDTLAMTLNVPKKQLSVEFRDLHLYSQPIIRDQVQLRLCVSMERGKGNFEVLDGNIKVATGIIVAWKPKEENNDIKIHTAQNMVMKSEDIYELLREREYMYSGEFRSIDCASASLTEASLIWRDNWVSLIDGMLQLNMLRQHHDTVTLPSHIRQIRIDVEEHEKTKIVTDDQVTYKAEIVETFGSTRCGGILMENIRYRHLPALVEDKMELQTLKFVPINQTDQQVATSLQIFVQMVAENVNKDAIRVVGLKNKKNGSIFNEMKNIGSNVFGVNVQYEEFNDQDDLRSRTIAIKNAEVVIVQNLSTDENMCQLLHRLLQPDMFIINEEEQLQGSRLRPSSLCSVLSSHRNARSRLELIRFRSSFNAIPTTAITVQSGSELSLVTSARSHLSVRHRLLIIAPYPAPPGLKDLVRGWRKESERNLINLISIRNEDGSNFLLDEPPNVNLAFIVLNHGVWGGEYYVPAEDSVQLSNNVTLQSAQVGEISSLKWVEASELDKSGIAVKVHYAGINTTDVKKANGIIPLSNNGENDYGIDFSGTTESGERVMGLLRCGAASSVVRAQPELLWPVPAHWSLEDAATVPYAYAHALYCLTIKSSLKVGMAVMVHGGAGALGQAVIAIALAFGCEVFTTVSDMRKKRFLLKLFPELRADHIGNSRDQTFKDTLLNWIPRGCDIVISSSRGAMKKISLDCAAQNGICLDVAQLQHQDEEFEYGLHYLTKERSYAVVDFASIFESQNIEEIKELHRQMSEGIRKGFIRPLSRVTCGQADVSRAFCLLAASRHRGRVLLRMSEDKTQAQPRLVCNSNNTHVIVLDEDMFGLKLAARLVARGARKLLIHYHGNVTAKLQFKLMNWQKIGVQIQVLSKDLSDANNILELFDQANQLGPVEGVYGITNEKGTLTEMLLANLDSASRKLCPNLRYFAAINIGETTVGQQTCISRTQSKLPSTVITLPQLNPLEGNRDALDVLERALRSSDSVLAARLASEQRPDLLRQLSTLAGVTVTDETPKSATLEELGLPEDNIQFIITYFKVHHNVDFTEEEVPKLTIETILNVEKPENELQDVKGLGTFLTYVDPDELLATIDMVFTSTLTSWEHSMGDDEFDTSLTNLCVVPGMEGNHQRFRVLSERLKLPALVLQPGLDRPHETVRETAERYTQVLLKKAIFNKKFYLLGFETGILVALEIASILEDLGLTGTVYCLGCAPDEVQSIIEENISEYDTEELLQNAVVEHMCKLMVDSKTENLKEALKGAVTWPEKVEAGVRTMLGHMPHSAQYARAFIDAALARIQSARRCVAPARALRSQLVMMRAALPDVEEAKQALQKHSQRPVIVYQLDTPLAHVASDIRCASIINRHLDSEILEMFEKSNICDSYILNANSFMAVEN